MEKAAFDPLINHIWLIYQQHNRDSTTTRLTISVPSLCAYQNSLIFVFSALKLKHLGAVYVQALGFTTIRPRTFPSTSE